MPISRASETNFLKGKSPQVIEASTSNTTLTTVVSVTGGGILTNISQFINSIMKGGGLTANLQIEIDGSTVFTDNTFTSAYSSTSETTTSSNNMTFLFEFNSSLVIKHRVTSAGSVNTIVSYLLN